MEMARRLHEMVESRNDTREQIRGLVQALHHSFNDRVANDDQVVLPPPCSALVLPKYLRDVAASDPIYEWRQSSDRRSEQHQGGASVSAELVRMSQPKNFGWDTVGQQISNGRDGCWGPRNGCAVLCPLFRCPD